MRKKWIHVVVSLAVAGTVLLLFRKRFGRMMLHFVSNPEQERNFGEFPPEIPEEVFDGITFV